MSTLKNQFQRARSILESLVQGTHPKTGDELPKDSVANEIEVSRAMATAVLALDQMCVRLARRAQLPESVGKAWTEEEEQQLRNEFGGPGSISDIAAKHRRTIRAIEARLEKLGLLRLDQPAMVNSVTRAKRPGGAK
jgi:hypothetical protein